VVFEYGGEQIAACFFMNDMSDGFLLCKLLLAWYRKKYMFEEYNYKQERTWLLQYKTGKELEAFKQEYGIG
jgi:hypothetical protein